jgi:hypothetical protein
MWQPEISGLRPGYVTSELIRVVNEPGDRKVIKYNQLYVQAVQETTTRCGCYEADILDIKYEFRKSQFRTLKKGIAILNTDGAIWVGSTSHNFTHTFLIKYADLMESRFTLLTSKPFCI